ncbi:MAG TPA: hypothetical protein VHA30_02310, partial [Patescibacteria group bacterium]|nr:hypothetical protein [Patescibacteria group bacterium]
MERKHKQKLRLWLMLAVDAAFLVLVFFLVTHARIRLHFEVLSPGGVIAAQQRRLLVTAVSIMLIAAVPVYILIFYFIAKYRADRQGAAYEPDLQSGKASTFALWAVPVAIILALSVINWNSSHALDPYKPIASGRTPVTIQVVALQWKWLFIYPEQGIAT